MILSTLWRRARPGLVAGCVGALLGPVRLSAQQTLAQAAERARAAWQAGDMRALVARSASLQLQIPGAEPSAPVGRDQAAHLIQRYLERTEERNLVMIALRESDRSEGFAELERHYVIRRTRDERCETVWFGFKKLGRNWVLSEVRIAP